MTGEVTQELAVDHQLFMMAPKGTPIREQVFHDNPCFLDDTDRACYRRNLPRQADISKVERLAG